MPDDQEFDADKLKALNERIQSARAGMTGSSVSLGDALASAGLPPVAPVSPGVVPPRDAPSVPEDTSPVVPPAPPSPPSIPGSSAGTFPGGDDHFTMNPTASPGPSTMMAEPPSSMMADPPAPVPPPPPVAPPIPEYTAPVPPPPPVAPPIPEYTAPVQAAPPESGDALIASVQRMTNERQWTFTGAPEAAAPSMGQTAPGPSQYQAQPAPTPAPEYMPSASSHLGHDDMDTDIASGLNFAEDPNIISRASATTVDDRRLQLPRSGWRRAAAKAAAPFGKTVKKSLAEQRLDNDIQLIRQRFTRGKVITVVSFKGGTGKTAVVAGLGNTFATYRKFGPVAGVDADEKGNLARRIHSRQRTDRNVKSLAGIPQSSDPLYMQGYMVAGDSGFGVVGSATSVKESPLTPNEFTTVVNNLQAHYSVVLVDTDASAAAPVFNAAMHKTDALVIVLTPYPDSVHLANMMLDWIRENDLARLLPRTVIAVNHSIPGKERVKTPSIVTHFGETEGLKVVGIPFDPHLNEAAEMHLDLLDRLTRRRFIRLAAVLMEALSSSDL